MGLKKDSTKLVADEVSSDTIRRLNFLAANSLQDLRNTNVIFTLAGTRYRLQITDDARVLIDRCDAYPQTDD